MYSVRDWKPIRNHPKKSYRHKADVPKSIYTWPKVPNRAARVWTSWPWMRVWWLWMIFVLAPWSVVCFFGETKWDKNAHCWIQTELKWHQVRRKSQTEQMGNHFGNSQNRSKLEKILMCPCPVDFCEQKMRAEVKVLKFRCTQTNMHTSCCSPSSCPNWRPVQIGISQWTLPGVFACWTAI